VASHDLKAPLRVIDNASRWLEEDLSEKLTDEDRENMTLLRNRVARMEKLLDDLLTYSRIGRGADETFREVLTAASLIGDVMMLLSPSPSIHVEIPDDFASIEVYRMPLQQVFYNLINNAIKHHDSDTVGIELECTLAGDEVSFTVRDDGPGIPAEFHDKIFEMFHTLKPRDQVEGSGMGLAMVKKTVEHFGGTITVASEGRGTAFTFAWPRQKQQHEPSVQETSGKAA
jgi:signal transduction histidine kinase